MISRDQLPFGRSSWKMAFPYGFNQIFGLVHAYLLKVQGTWQCALICQVGYTIMISITLTSFHEPLSRTKHVGILSNDPIHVGKESSQHVIFKLLKSQLSAVLPIAASYVGGSKGYISASQSTALWDFWLEEQNDFMQHIGKQVVVIMVEVQELLNRDPQIQDPITKRTKTSIPDPLKDPKNGAPPI